MRVERPTGPPPSARWRAHAPRQPGRRAPNPRSANLRISPRRARQTTWRTARSPAPRFLRPFLQIPNAPPCSRGVHVAPRPRSAPSPPPGLPRSLTPPAPRPDLRGTENTPPTRAARAETVKRRKEIAGDGELRDSLYLLFSEQLYGTKKKKKKKKKKGEGDRREQEGESRRRRAGEREREGARGVSGWTCVCAREGTRGGSGHRQR
ncbi:serine/arginine repetitive matrix protein 1-like [Symphalangus syndactylus]|uniref:serine/arginine repetitive matrix protein 1-like n=1 Tax=Symphalangus syndactylus TaxID=9590 RepID=UPI003006119A